MHSANTTTEEEEWEGEAEEVVWEPRYRNPGGDDYKETDGFHVYSRVGFADVFNGPRRVSTLSYVTRYRCHLCD